MDTSHLKKYNNPYRILDYEMNNYDGAHTTKIITNMFLKYVSNKCKEHGYTLKDNFKILNDIKEVVYWIYISKQKDIYLITIYNKKKEREFIFSESELLKLIDHKS